MRRGVSFTVSAEDRARLRAIVEDRNSAQKHVWRGADRPGQRRRSGDDGDHGSDGEVEDVRPALAGMASWERASTGFCGTRHGLLAARKPLSPARVATIVCLTQTPPAGEATHWTLRAMAKAAGVAASTVRTIWQAHGLAPHRWRQFKLLTDPAFVDKVRDIVGLYVEPPAHAAVLSIDEKFQIQALDRTQPGLPLKRGRGATMTRDYKRHGTTTLFAALDVLESLPRPRTQSGGTVISQHSARHRHEEFVRFLDRIDRTVAAGTPNHAILAGANR